MEHREKIKKFTDLYAWKEAHTIVLLTYKLTTSFPREEQFGLVNQMRRAAVSISSNIAEGFGRSTSKDKEHFYIMAKGSLLELENQFIVAKDLDYTNKNDFNKISLQIEIVGKLLTGLTRSVSSYTRDR